MNEPSKKRWRRLRLGTLLAVVTMLCVCLGLKVNEAKWQKQIGRVVTTGAITGNELNTVYDIVEFTNGKYGLIIVANSGGNAEFDTEMVRTLGQARMVHVVIDGDTYSFQIPPKDSLSHDDNVISYLHMAMERRAPDTEYVFQESTD